MLNRLDLLHGSDSHLIILSIQTLHEPHRVVNSNGEATQVVCLVINGFTDHHDVRVDLTGRRLLAWLGDRYRRKSFGGNVSDSLLQDKLVANLHGVGSFRKHGARFDGSAGGRLLRIVLLKKC